MKHTISVNGTSLMLEEKLSVKKSKLDRGPLIETFEYNTKLLSFLKAK